jgi:hypothetical protein
VKKEEGSTLIFQKRDVDILKALYACRYLTTTQIQKVFFGRNRSVVCERLNKKLLPHGFLNRHFRDVAFQTTDAVYSVGQAGIKLLAEELKAESREIKRGLESGAEPLFLRHLLESNDLWADLREISRDGHAPCTLLSWWTEKKLRGLHSPERQHYPIPDSRFVLGYKDGSRAHFFVEVDRGTETPRVFQTKVRKYLAYFLEGGQERDFGFKSFRVLTVVPDKRRLERLLYISAEAGANNIFLFTMKGEIAAQGILGRIWITPRDHFVISAGDGGRYVVREREDGVEKKYTIME